MPGALVERLADVYSPDRPLLVVEPGAAAPVAAGAHDVVLAAPGVAPGDAVLHAGRAARWLIVVCRPGVTGGRNPAAEWSALARRHGRSLHQHLIALRAPLGDHDLERPPGGGHWHLDVLVLGGSR
jgi:hypothetical protein